VGNNTGEYYFSAWRSNYGKKEDIMSCMREQQLNDEI